MFGIRHLAAGAALWGAIAAGPARADCWEDSDAAAARLRALQTRLMVETLRCHAAGIDISATYNDFVRARHTVLEIANAGIRRHYGAGAEGQARYDGFVTTLANGYGAGPTDAATCAEAAQQAIDAADPTTDLARIAAEQEGGALPGERCTHPAPILASAAPIEAAAAPAPPLPDEVVRAMAIVTAYARAHPAPAIVTAQAGQ